MSATKQKIRFQCIINLLIVLEFSFNQLTFAAWRVSWAFAVNPTLIMMDITDLAASTDNSYVSVGNEGKPLQEKADFDREIEWLTQHFQATSKLKFKYNWSALLFLKLFAILIFVHEIKFSIQANCNRWWRSFSSWCCFNLYLTSF